METGLYVALSSQIALEQRLNTIAHNVANSNTTGFRAGKVRFDEVLSGLTRESPSFVSQGQSFAAPDSGGVIETGGSLDFAVKGDAWFAVSTPAGTVVTRDGRFKLDDAGGLVSMDGHSVQDPGGAPIQLDPAGGEITVSTDGILMVNGALAGAIGLFEYRPAADFKRYGNSGIVAETEPQAIVDQSNVGVLHGFLENSNVNPIQEMSNLIIVQRTFDNIANAIRDSEATFKEAIRTLGPRR